MYLLSRAVPQVARQRGISLQYPIHTLSLRTRHAPMGRCLARLAVVSVRGFQFIEVSIWTGRGCARRAICLPKLPMTVAPEGGTNGQ